MTSMVHTMKVFIYLIKIRPTSCVSCSNWSLSRATAQEAAIHTEWPCLWSGSWLWNVLEAAGLLNSLRAAPKRWITRCRIIRGHTAAIVKTPGHSEATTIKAKGTRLADMASGRAVTSSQIIQTRQRVSPRDINGTLFHGSNGRLQKRSVWRQKGGRFDQTGG